MPTATPSPDLSLPRLTLEESLALMDVQLAHLTQDPDARLVCSNAMGMAGWLTALAQQVPTPWPKACRATLSRLLAQVAILAARSEPVASDHRWPQRLLDVDQQASAWDAELLAALLVELGADPWQGVSKDQPLGGVLPAALGQLWAGLCERIWAAERGRPPLKALQQAKPVGQKKSIRTWLDWTSEQPEGAATVRWLLAVGVRSAKGNHALAFAANEAVFGAYQHAGYLPATATERRNVITAWESRLQKKALSGSTVKALKARLTQGQSGAPLAEDSEALTMIQEIFATGAWNTTDGFNKLSLRPTVQECLGRATLSRGAHAGNWSVFTALMVRELRPCWTGMSTANIHRLITAPFLNEEKGLLSYRSTLDWAALKGQLKGAKDFDWNPGISINGALGMELMAYVSDKKDDLELLCGALGIDDFHAWWRFHVRDAAAFSEALADRAENAQQRLSSLWAYLLRADPGALDHQEEAALLLLRMFQRSRSYYSDDPDPRYSLYGEKANDEVTFRLEGSSYSHPGAWFHSAVFKPMKNRPLTVDWLVELFLWWGPHQGPWGQRLLEAASAGLLEKRHIERVKTYLKRSSQDAAKHDRGNHSMTQDLQMTKHLQPWLQGMNRHLQAWSLAQKMPAASTQPKRERL